MAGFGGTLPQFLVKYRIEVPPSSPGRTPEDADSRAIATSVASRVPDGIAVWRDVQAGAHTAWLSTWAGVDAGPIGILLDDYAAQVSMSFARLFSQPAGAGDSAWLPSHLEYQFAVGTDSADSNSVPTLRADQYTGHRLDWFSFDAVMQRPLPGDGQAPPAGNAPAADDAGKDVVESFLPAPVRFKGQPEARFWQMEESQTDFGKIETSTTGLAAICCSRSSVSYTRTTGSCCRTRCR